VGEPFHHIRKEGRKEEEFSHLEVYVTIVRE
jgi:hypothetical protein